MWTRGELKEKAKATLKTNYWKTVLIALLVLILGGAGALGALPGAAGGRGAESQGGVSVSAYQDTDGRIVVDWDDEGDILVGVSEDEALDEEELEEEIAQLVDSQSETTRRENFTMGAIVLGMLFVLVIAALALGIVVEALVVNPTLVGTSRFFLRNLNQRAQVAEVGYGFDNNYREVAKTMFWRDIYTLLWALLFVVPGIIKSYEYRMIPYLLADDPTMTKDRAFSESKRLMSGQKWNAFVLDLSFLGWEFLSLFTLGLLAIFYVAPYKCMTDAALYERLRYGTQGTEACATLPGTFGSDSAAAMQVPVPQFAAEPAPEPTWGEDRSEDATDADGVVPDTPEA